MPDTAVKISTDLYNQFAGVSWPEGKMLMTNESGEPTWGDVPPLTGDELIAQASARKEALIDQANAYMNSKQWPGKAAIGRLKGDELIQYNLWLDHLDSLEAVDTLEAPDIEWPVPPDI
nr:tail fiber assembly protein [Enterobacter kobei]